MENKLAAFRAAYTLLPWEPGKVDCCLCLASWAMWIGRADPAPHLRGVYNTEEGFRAIISAAGGVVPVVAKCVAVIGGKPLQRPLCGSVGVIGSRSNINRQFGAIYDGEQWLVRFTNTFAPMVARPLAIWSI